MTFKAPSTNTFVRKYMFQFLIFLFSLILLMVLSAFISEKATKNHAQMVRFQATEFNEIVFSSVPNFDEAFYNFNGNASAYTKNGKRMLCDILMTDNERTYEKNPLYLKHTPEEGCCAISENLAFQFGLSVGDLLKLTVGSDNTAFEFQISDILPAQSGIDEKYSFYGVLILSENTDFIENGRYIYTSFTKDGDEYHGLLNDAKRNIIYTENIIKEAKNQLLIYALVAIVVFSAAIALFEIIIFSKIGKKYRDYSILVSYGIPQKRFFGVVYRDMFIKYLLPLIIIFVIGFVQFSYYRISYILPSGIFAAIGVIFITVFTFIIVRREMQCLKIKRSFSKSKI